MIKAEVRYTLEHFKAFSNKTISAVNLIGLCFFNIMFTLLLILIIVKDDKVETLYLVLSIVGWSALIVLLALSYLISPKRLYNNYKCSNSNSVVLFDFEDDTFSVSWHSDAADGKTNYNYKILESAEEKGDFFVLKATQVGMWAIKKSDIIEGTPSEFEQLLKRNLGERFTISQQKR